MKKPHALIWSALAILVTGWAQVREGDGLLYNHSPSIPPGLYVRTSGPVGPASIVTVRAVDVAPDYARCRGFTDSGDRFIKRVAAIGGAEVCAHGTDMRVNGHVIAYRREQDSEGRDLHAWVGCRSLTDGEVLLLGDTNDSFDGRYWGPISRDEIEGVWWPLRF